MSSHFDFFKVAALRVLLGSTLLLSGCAKNVEFNRAISDLHETGLLQADSQKNIVRSYQDYSGDFYPTSPTQLSVDYKDGKASCVHRDDRRRTQKCEAASGQFPEYKVCETKCGCSCDTQQDLIVEDLAEQLIGALSSDTENLGQRTLVILIHGFNVTNAEGSYALTRDVIQTHLRNKQQPVYWQVNWDGMSITLTRFLQAWSKAQGNGPLVGLKMRRVMDKVLTRFPNTPVRIITHSSGAFVAASLLGNNSNALKMPGQLDLTDKNAQRNYCVNTFYFLQDHIKGHNGYPVPQSPDMRLGLLAPATPSNSFAVFLEESQCGNRITDEEGLLTRKLDLVLGVNDKDVAITKGILPSSAGGATTLGVNRNVQCLLKKGIDQINERHRNKHEIKVQFIDFSNSVANKNQTKIFYESHDLSAYLARDAMPVFLDALFGKPTDVVEDRSDRFDRRFDPCSKQ